MTGSFSPLADHGRAPRDESSHGWDHLHAGVVRGSRGRGPGRRHGVAAEQGQAPELLLPRVMGGTFDVEVLQRTRLPLRIRTPHYAVEGAEFPTLGCHRFDWAQAG